MIARPVFMTGISVQFPWLSSSVKIERHNWEILLTCCLQPRVSSLKTVKRESLPYSLLIDSIQAYLPSSWIQLSCFNKIDIALWDHWNHCRYHWIAWIDPILCAEDGHFIKGDVGVLYPLKHVSYNRPWWSTRSDEITPPGWTQLNIELRKQFTIFNNCLLDLQAKRIESSGNESNNVN